MNAVLPAVDAVDAVDAVPVNDADYQVGKIMYASWGYDQTNIDWYKIVKRSKSTVWLQPIGDMRNETHFMAGVSMPQENVNAGPIIRRKLHMRDGKIIGCSFEQSYGWINAWDGKPKGYSSYA